MSRRVSAALSHKRCSGHPASKPEGPKSCVSIAGAGHRGHGQRQGCVPRRVTLQGREQVLQLPGTPPAGREPETSPHG